MASSVRESIGSDLANCADKILGKILDRQMIVNTMQVDKSGPSVYKKVEWLKDWILSDKTTDETVA